MVKFGPSGYCTEFLEKYSHTEQMPAWLTSHGLSVYEYAFNKGINLSDEKAKIFGKLFHDASIELTVHGPYYINFANPDDEMAEKSKMYVINSLLKMKLMGATKLVVHPGSVMKQSREVAFELTKKRFKELAGLMDEYGIKDMYVCPETMGKHGQIGTVEEVAEICAIDERFMPAVDFGHVNAFTLGGLKTEEDYEQIFKTLEKYLGKRGRNIHIHFSPVMYGEKGELKHLDFNDDPDGFGPPFEPLARVMKKLGVNATIVSESRSFQTRDAVTMKNIFEKIN